MFNSKKFIEYIVIIGTLICCILLVILFLYNHITPKITSIDKYILADKSNYKYDIESIDSIYNGDKIKGWAVESSVTYDFYNYGWGCKKSGVYNDINLALVKDNKVYSFSTSLSLRKDINERLNDNIDYQYCGFESIINKKFVDDLQSYELALIFGKPDGSKELLILGRDYYEYK